MSQIDLLNVLKQEPRKWFTNKDLAIKMSRDNIVGIGRMTRQMSEFQIIDKKIKKTRPKGKDLFCFRIKG